MKSKHLEELIRTNNPVELSYIRARLEEYGIDFILLDDFTSGMEGSIGAIPRRIMVAAEDKSAALRVLEDVIEGE